MSLFHLSWSVKGKYEVRFFSKRKERRVPAMCNFGYERVGKVSVNVKELGLKRIGCKGKITMMEPSTWFDEPNKGLC